MMGIVLFAHLEAVLAQHAQMRRRLVRLVDMSSDTVDRRQGTEEMEVDIADDPVTTRNGCCQEPSHNSRGCSTAVKSTLQY
jgi:hypothetical protein